jgi:hypothetical protein
MTETFDGNIQRGRSGPAAFDGRGSEWTSSACTSAIIFTSLSLQLLHKKGFAREIASYPVSAMSHSSSYQIPAYICILKAEGVPEVVYMHLENPQQPAPCSHVLPRLRRSSHTGVSRPSCNGFGHHNSEAPPSLRRWQSNCSCSSSSSVPPSLPQRQKSFPPGRVS